MRLLFEPEWLTRGRKRRPPILLPEDVKAERARLLAELQVRPPHERLATTADRIIARELETRTKALTPQIKQLLRRKNLRPVDVANQLLAWKYHTRSAAIQDLTAAAPEPPDILHG